MISLERRDGRPLRIAHRGAPALAPENTLAAFRAALEVGVDLVEFDVIGLETASSSSRTRAGRSSRRRRRSTRRCASSSTRRPTSALHLDLKLTERERDVVDAIRRPASPRGPSSAPTTSALRAAIAALDGDIRIGFTVPRRVFRISEHGRSAPIARIAPRALRWLTPPLVGPCLRRPARPCSCSTIPW